MNLKTLPVLLSLLSLSWSRSEGSGGFKFISDDSDLDYDDEASGDTLDTLLLLPDDEDDDSYKIPFESKNQDYDDDLNEYIYSDEDDDDYDLTLTVDDDQDEYEVEITNDKEDLKRELVLETSQILIMVGSAFVSFGVAMITFFCCKRSLEKRKQKALTVNTIQRKEVILTSSPIVKNYQRVPTDTQEYLKNQDTHIEMYRAEQEAMQQNDPLIK